jgi:hypothetical protein
MGPAYIHALKDFIEGKRDLREWPIWWRGNARIIEEAEGRTRYLKIKLYWREGAYQILEHHGIAYKLNEGINWARCKECGEPLFHAIPHETTKEQIREFVRNSNWPNKAQVEKEGWLHPWVYCPNCCTEIWFNYR